MSFFEENGIEEINQAGRVWMREGQEHVGFGVEPGRRFVEPERIVGQGYRVRDRGDGHRKTPRFVAERKP